MYLSLPVTNLVVPWGLLYSIRRYSGGGNEGLENAKFLMFFCHPSPSHHLVFFLVFLLQDWDISQLFSYEFFGETQRRKKK
jgi:hypothetical protein